MFGLKERGVGAADPEVQADKVRALRMATELRRKAEALAQAAAELQEEIERGRGEREDADRE